MKKRFVPALAFEGLSVISFTKEYKKMHCTSILFTILINTLFM